jgi:hypothetical protein
MAGRGIGQGNPMLGIGLLCAQVEGRRRLELGGAIILLGVPSVWVSLNIFDLGN